MRKAKAVARAPAVTSRRATGGAEYAWPSIARTAGLGFTRVAVDANVMGGDYSQVRWYGGSIEFEADPKHATVLCDAFELCGKSAGTEAPIAKEAKEDVQKEDEEPVGKEEATKSRALATTGNYLSQDRTDIQYAAK